MNDERLWPRFSGPGDLAEIERIPLSQRGLPASTYELVTRAARLWPERLAVSVAADRPRALEPLAGVEVSYLQERMDKADDGGLPGAPPAAGEIASYLHTGGTTGTPKLAARTHANEVSNAWMIEARDLLEQRSVLFAALPLFHTNALVVTLLAPLLKGQHVVWGGPLGYRDVPLYGNFWKIVEHFRIAAMSAVPKVYSVRAARPGRQPTARRRRARSRRQHRRGSAQARHDARHTGHDPHPQPAHRPRPASPSRRVTRTTGRARSASGNRRHSVPAVGASPASNASSAAVVSSRPSSTIRAAL